MVVVKKKMGDDAQSECESQRRLRVQVKKKWKKEEANTKRPRSGERVSDEKVRECGCYRNERRRRLLGRRPGKKGRGLSWSIGRRASKLTRPASARCKGPSTTAETACTIGSVLTRDSLVVVANVDVYCTIH